MPHTLAAVLDMPSEYSVSYTPLPAGGGCTRKHSLWQGIHVKYPQTLQNEQTGYIHTMGDQDLIHLRDKLRTFVADRDWDQFHAPKNLAIALVVEASELLEIYQWLTEAESRELAGEKRAKVAMELADILIYLVRLADKLDVDLLDAVTRKLEINEQRYPAGKVRGRAVKYNEI